MSANQLSEQRAIPIGRFGRVCGFTPDPARSLAVGRVAARLSSLPEYARKLLAHVIDLVQREHADGRKPGAGCFPELHDTCGLGVDEMYVLLQQLEDVGFIRIEGDYPFQEVVLAEEPGSHWPVMRDLARFCSSEQIPLRTLIVDLRTDLLA